MSQFSVEKFAADPSAELTSIQNAKKQELLELASHLSIVTRTNMRKHEIRNLILEHYMRVGRLGNEAKQYITRDPEALTLEQKLEYERIALERQKLDAQSERIRLEFEIEKARKQLELENELAKEEKNYN